MRQAGGLTPDSFMEIANTPLNTKFKPEPPLGVRPKEIWLKERICELSRAIYECVGVGRIDDGVYEWVTDLENLIASVLEERNDK